MIARGIQRYHRPARVEEALRLVAAGGRPLGGGTRLLAEDAELPEVVDLGALGWDAVAESGTGLAIGALVRLQDLADSPAARAASAGLLPAACRAHSVSPLLRGMATLGGEAVHGAHDSPVVAALLALGATGERAGGGEPTWDLAEPPAAGGLVRSIALGEAPGGAALETLAVLPSAPPILAAAAALWTRDGRCARARVALSGLAGRPARAAAVEAALEGRPLDEGAFESAARAAAEGMAFREDAHAPASYRRRIAPVLVARALRAAAEGGRAPRAGEAGRPWSPPLRTAAGAEAPFTRGRLAATLNGAVLAIEVEARTTLLEAVRRAGATGVKHGCETGECGACAVLVDGRPVASCMTLAAAVAGRRLLTVEGLGEPSRLSPVQQAFVDLGAIQCGYCTPAMELCAEALLDAVPDPSEAEVRDALAGCLCRCTGYVKPVEAVLLAARARRVP